MEDDESAEQTATKSAYKRQKQKELELDDWKGSIEQLFKVKDWDEAERDNINWLNIPEDAKKVRNWAYIFPFDECKQRATEWVKAVYTNPNPALWWSYVLEVQEFRSALTHYESLLGYANDNTIAGLPQKTRERIRSLAQMYRDPNSQCPKPDTWPQVRKERIRWAKQVVGYVKAFRIAKEKSISPQDWLSISDPNWDGNI